MHSDRLAVQRSVTRTAWMVSAVMLLLLCTICGPTLAASYTQAFDSGTDSWESKDSSGNATGSVLANVSDGESGNCLSIYDTGYGWGTRRLVTGVLAGETYQLSIWVKLPTTTNYQTYPWVFCRQENYSNGLVRLDQTPKISTFSDWTLITLSGTIAAGCTQVRIGLYGNRSSGAQTSYLDTVTFTSSLNTPRTLSLVSNPAGTGSLLGGGIYDSGASANVSATANPGYTWSKWTSDQAGNNLLSTSASFSYTMQDVDATIYAQFAPNSYTLTTIATAGGSISGDSGSKTTGAASQVSATPDTGCCL